MFDRKKLALALFGALSLASVAGLSLFASAATEQQQVEAAATDDCPPKACSIAFETIHDGPPSIVILATDVPAAKAGQHQPDMVLLASTADAPASQR